MRVKSLPETLTSSRLAWLPSLQDQSYYPVAPLLRPPGDSLSPYLISWMPSLAFSQFAPSFVGAHLPVASHESMLNGQTLWNPVWLKMSWPFMGGLLRYEILGWKQFSFKILKTIPLCSNFQNSWEAIHIPNLLYETIFFFLLRAENLCPSIQNIQLIHPRWVHFHLLCWIFFFFLELMFFSSGEFSWMISVVIFSPPLFLEWLLFKDLVS